MQPKVLLATTSRWFTTARLGIALKNAGCVVDALCPVRHPLTQTDVVERIHIYNGLFPLRSFEDAILRTAPDLVLPCDDVAARQLHELHNRSRSQGSRGQAICTLIESSLGAPQHLPGVYARAAFMTLAATEGIRVPQTQAITNQCELEKCASQIGFPMVLKADGTSGGVGVRIVQSMEEAMGALQFLQSPPWFARAFKRALIDRDYTLLRPWLLRRRTVVNAQGFIAGHEATSAVACWKGTVLASLHFEVLSKANAAGHATVLRLIENPEMASAAEAICRRLRLSGVHGFDFMLEAETSKAFLIEMNPRATQVGHLTLGVGRDLPAALHAAVTGDPIQCSPRLTDNHTIALFPQEWIRDPQSSFLQTGYHDVPWDQPDLLQDCIRARARQYHPNGKNREKPVASSTRFFVAPGKGVQNISSDAA
jgi:ATP-grasp domain